jgi:hypothetical protein
MISTGSICNISTVISGPSAALLRFFLSHPDGTAGLDFASVSFGIGHEMAIPLLSHNDVPTFNYP